MRAIVVALVILTLPLAVGQNTSVCASSSDDPDRDNDGLPDAWECKYFGSLKYTGSDDPDGDGFDNKAEWRADSDPDDDDSYPRTDAGNSGSGSGNSGSGSGSSGSGASGAGNGSGGDGNQTSENKTVDERPQREGLYKACKDADDRKECAKEYCRTHKDDARCRELVKQACKDRQIDCAALDSACIKATANGATLDTRAEVVCKQLQKVDDIRVDARFVSFSVDKDGRQLVDYGVQGTVLFRAIQWDDDEDDFEVRKDGARIRFQSDDARLEIHDNPKGDFWFKTDEERLNLVLVPGTDVTPASNGLLLRIGNEHFRLAGKDIDHQGDVITLAGHTTFFRVGGPDSASRIVDEAKASGRLGAKVAVTATSAAGIASADSADVTAYDDVGIVVEQPQQITNSTPLRVIVNATLDEGRTIIVDVDPAMLGGPELQLAYYDLNDDGTETEVVFRQAGSLEDVMDASDDGGQPEYWIVEDADGIHVMASIPHWSTHIIEIASVGEFLRQPSVIIGVAAGVLGVGVASVSMFWPRRRDDEF